MARRKRKGATIHVLPGIERRDILGTLPAERLLQNAIKAGVTEPIVVARDRHGDLYIASAMPDVDRAVGYLMRAATFLASSTIENDQVVDTGEGGK